MNGRNLPVAWKRPDSIVVMPRTSGYVVTVGFEDGAHVKKGDLLFQIDYRTIRAEVEQLKAEVRRTEAEIELSERDLKRAESLRKKSAISQEQLDNSRTRLTQGQSRGGKRESEFAALESIACHYDREGPVRWSGVQCAREGGEFCCRG